MVGNSAVLSMDTKTGTGTGECADISVFPVICYKEMYGFDNLG